MPLIVFLSSSISPCTSAETFLLRSPSATAPITRCISLLGRTRSSIRLLTDSMQLPQTWSVPLKETRWESLPSLPTTRLTRSSSVPSAWFAPMISLSQSATLPSTPVQWTGMRAVKSPALTSLRTLSSTSVSRTAAAAAGAGFVGMGLEPESGGGETLTKGTRRDRRHCMSRMPSRKRRRSRPLQDLSAGAPAHMICRRTGLPLKGGRDRRQRRHQRAFLDQPVDRALAQRLSPLLVGALVEPGVELELEHVDPLLRPLRQRLPDHRAARGQWRFAHDPWLRRSSRSRSAPGGAQLRSATRDQRNRDGGRASGSPSTALNRVHKDSASRLRSADRPAAMRPKRPHILRCCTSLGGCRADRRGPVPDDVAAVVIATKKDKLMINAQNNVFAAKLSRRRLQGLHPGA